MLHVPERRVPKDEPPERQFAAQRLGLVMAPDPHDPNEALGVLNPAAARDPDGALFLFPRVVAQGNYSRIGRAKVLFDPAGTPTGVQRMGYVLEPEAEYERNNVTGGGCEDPRVVYVPALGQYVMAYTAFGPHGPRVAVALSTDLVTWHRLGLLQFARARVDFSELGNKDASFFPEPVVDPDGKSAFAILHRPTYRRYAPDGSERVELPPKVTDPRETIWISYVNLDRALRDVRWLTHVHDNHVLMTPRAPWEQVKLGGGCPPVAIPQGWMIVYHGIRALYQPDGSPAARGEYCVGVAVLDKDRPWHVLYRTPEPVLVPLVPEELEGVVPRVVFPTGIDRRADLGPGVFDLYYGVADTRIAAARLRLPAVFPLQPRRLVHAARHERAAGTPDASLSRSAAT